MKALTPNAGAQVGLKAASDVARPVLDAAIVGNKVAEKMVEDVAVAFEKFGVVDDRAIAAMFQRAVVGEPDAPPAFSTEKGAIAKMLARAKGAKPGDTPEKAQEAAIQHIRKHYGDKMSTDATRVLDVVDQAQQCHKANKPIPKALVDELKGSGALTGGSGAALAYVRKQYVSVLSALLMDHIDGMLDTWSHSLFHSGLEQSAEQARRQEEENARAFQQMLDADSATHQQVQQKHSTHVGKKHQIQFAKIDFDAGKRELSEAKDDFEVGKEEVNEADQDYGADMLAAAEAAEDHAHANGAKAKGASGGGPKANTSAWHAAMLNVRFPGTSKSG